MLPTYIEHFVQLLSSHDDVNTGPGLRKEVITTLDCLLTHYPMLLRPHLMTIVTPIWDVLVSSTDMYPCTNSNSSTVYLFLNPHSYIRNVVNSCDSFVDDYDSDGEIINFDSGNYVVQCGFVITCNSFIWYISVYQYTIGLWSSASIVSSYTS